MIEETLRLDLAEAFAGVEELGERVSAAVAGADAALVAAVSSGVDAAAGALSGLTAAVEGALAAGGEAGADALQAALAGLSVSVPVEVELPDAGVTERGLADLLPEVLSVPVEYGEPDALVVEPPDGVVVPVEYGELDVLTVDQPDPVVVPVEVEGLDDVESSIQALGSDPVEVTVEVDDSALVEAADGVAGLDGASAEVEVVVDGAALESTAESVSNLRDVAAEGIALGVEVDQSGFAEADALIAELAESANAIAIGDSGSLDAGGGGSGASDLLAGLSGGELAGAAGALAGVSKATDAATGGVAGLKDGLLDLTPGMAGIAAAGAGAALGIRQAFNEAVNAESALIRLNDVLGDGAAAFLDFSKYGIDGVETLQDLALATGSSDDAITVAGANFADLGLQAGYTTAEVTETAQGMALLASNIAATRPQLGTAESIMGRLSIVLQRGGRFAQRFGLDIGNAGEIAARASVLFDKPKSALTAYEKSVAGLTIATEKLGNEIPANIAKATDNPEIALRALTARLGEVIEAAGQPLVDPFIDALEKSAPAAEGLAESLGALGATVLPKLANSLALVGGLLADVAGILAAVAASPFGSFMIVAAASSVAFRGAVTGLLAVVSRAGEAFAKLTTALQTVGARISAVRTQGLAAAFRSTATNAAALGQALTQQAQASQAAIAAQQGVRTALAASLATTRSGTVQYGLLTAAQQANTAVMEAQRAVNTAALVVREKQTALLTLQQQKTAGAVVSDDALAVAEQNLATAMQRLTAATTARNIAVSASADATALAVQGEAIAEGQLAVAGQGAAAAELELAAANTAVNASARGASGAMATLSAVMGPISIVLGIVAGLWSVFAQGANDAKKATDAAGDSISAYTEALLAAGDVDLAGDQSGLAKRFQESDEAADEFLTKLDEVLDGGQTTFEGLSLSANKAGEAIRGNKEALAEFGQSLIDTKGEFSVDIGEQQIVTGKDPVSGADVTTSRPLDGGSQARLRQAAEDAFKATGSLQEADEAVKALAAELGVTATIETGRITRAYSEQVEAQRSKVENLVKGAEQEIEAWEKTGDASDAAVLEELAAIGALDQLEPAAQAAAKALLEEAAAAQKAEEETGALASIAEGDPLRKLAESAIAAAQALRDGDLSGANAGIDEARALKASDAYATLAPEIKAAVDELLAYADAEVAAAREAGDLIASTGELAFTMGELEDRLAGAAQKFVNLLSKQQQLGKASRDIRSQFDGLDETFDKLGDSLDDQSASFDAASVTAENYGEYLSLLPKAVQDAIEGRNQDSKNSKKERERQEDAIDEDSPTVAAAFAAGAFQPPSGSGEDDDDPERTAEEKAALVREAILGNADALEKANKKARDHSREVAGFFDELGIGIREEAAAMLETGSSIDQVTARINERRDALVAFLRERGKGDEEILTILSDQRLLPDQVALDLKVSGLDQVVDAVNRLGLVMIQLQTGLEPGVLEEILAIEDPTKELEKINELLAGLPEEQQILIRGALNIDDPLAAQEKAQRAVDAGDAIEFSVTAQTDLDAALAAGDEIARVVNSIDHYVQITPQLVDSVAEFDAAVAAEVEGLEATIATSTDPEDVAEAEARLDEIIEARDALIKAILDPASLSEAEAELAIWAASLTVTATGKIVWEEEAPIRQGAGTAAPGSSGRGSADRNDRDRGGGARVDPSLTRGTPAQTIAAVRLATEGAYQIKPYSAAETAAEVPKKVYELLGAGNADEIVKLIQRRRGRYPGFAVGGVTVDVDDDRERRRRLAAAGVLASDVAAEGAVEPLSSGFYPEEAFRLAEPGTQGEYVISRDPQFRERNQGLLTKAAADLGLRLPGGPVAAPSVQVPSINVSGPPSDPGLVAATEALTRATARLEERGVVSSSPEGRPGVTIENLTVQAPDPDSRTSTAVIEDVRTAVFLSRR